MENKPNKTSKLLEAINNLDIRKTKIESIPIEISSESIKEIEEWDKSNENIPKSIDKNDPTVVYIGFDFVTSSTKVIVRLPYLENKTSASAADSIVTLFNNLSEGSIVVDHNCSGFISPKPLYL